MPLRFQVWLRLTHSRPWGLHGLLEVTLEIHGLRSSRPGRRLIGAGSSPPTPPRHRERTCVHVRGRELGPLSLVEHFLKGKDLVLSSRFIKGLTAPLKVTGTHMS